MLNAVENWMTNDQNTVANYIFSKFIRQNAKPNTKVRPYRASITHVSMYI